MKKYSILLNLVVVVILLSMVGLSNAAPPKVIKMIPQNGKQDVDPALKQIRIEFDQDMNGGGFSICGGGPSFPELIGKPRWLDKRTLVADVKLKPNYEYQMSVNCPSFQNCKNVNGEPAEIYPVNFKTASAQPQDSNKTAQSPEVLNTQEIHYDIEPNGLMSFYMPNHIYNNGTKPITNTQFINSDFVHMTKMVDDKGRDVNFTANHTGGIYQYNVTFNEPIMPGTHMTYTTYGTMTGLIKSVSGKEDTYRFFMNHHPGTNKSTMRIETYLIPAGAEVVSTNPPDIKRTEKGGRIELHVEKVIPPGGNIITEFQYKLKAHIQK